ncbi:MAG: VWA domain-containing protein, partial [Clostridia bacterium]|nr:VWA domain-containing protein [Clostridia bacterium]
APPHTGTEETVAGAIRSAASRGIRLIPVVASNSDRETELFGRAIAAVTGGTYVFLTDDSGVGGSHLEPIVGDFEVELLHDVIVRIINEHKVG